ncbi:D-cysteine desulfhydrase [Thalassotalea piscium]|uniref:D-cysteine desulfhydrase/L-cysteate sulfo-lyase n=1 Tax=Thalassotalea piscium TaxID=1230533 RepID=A0A7X0TSS0_9GAMM|nr:D-cysteine desulfhydrase [Thalassotalea piscium]MBB6542414.1 D-cysteine desulfhydrase/L-cysteate sulfo-lyase [Thalassotalea piscium]
MSTFNSIPRVIISHSPTPLEPMPRLSSLFNHNLYVKRDDCTGLAGGGNKTRKLEYLVAAALANKADTLVTVGGMQSNHARQTAAAAAKFGLNCKLILEDVHGTPKSDFYHNGNMLLDKLLGASIHRLSDEQNCTEYAHNLMTKLQNNGKKPYFIPMGGSNPLGSLGYVHCAQEIVNQIKEQAITIDQIVLATGSAGTQAGLLAGLIKAGVDIPVLGICVSRSGNEQVKLVSELLAQTLTLMGLDPYLAEGRVVANGHYYGEGYGIATEEMIEAVRLCAQHEGLILDPVYTGKGMSGMIDLCRKGYFSDKPNILFLHTGGSQGVYAYQEIF